MARPYIAVERRWLACYFATYEEYAKAEAQLTDQDFGFTMSVDDRESPAEGSNGCALPFTNPWPSSGSHFGSTDCEFLVGYSRETVDALLSLCQSWLAGEHFLDAGRDL